MFPAMLAITLGLCAQEMLAESAYGFHRSLAVDPAQAVVLDVTLSSGNLRVAYSHDGEVTITAEGQSLDGGRLGASYFKAGLSVEQDGNRIQVHNLPDREAIPLKGRISYRIDVPYRTEVTSRVEVGTQSLTGLMGPVNAKGGGCAIKASYVAKGLQAEVESGNLDFEVIGGRAVAKTGSGSISATRLAQGIDAETADGDITLTVVGPSTAAIAHGAGRIEVVGARSTLDATTQTGELHMKAELHGDWHLHSASGTIRIELPPGQKADLDATTDSGTVKFDRDDIVPTPLDAHHVAEKLNGGGLRLEVRTQSGQILLR